VHENKRLKTFNEWRGSSIDEVVRALASMQSDPGSIPAQCHMWVEFAVGSHLAQRIFLRVLWFSSLLKNEHFHFPIRSG